MNRRKPRRLFVYNLMLQLYSFLLITLINIQYTYGIDSCNRCTAGNSCILETPDQHIRGGDQIIEISICNYDSSENYSIDLEPKTIPNCGQGKLKPNVASTILKQPCSDGSTCILQLTLENKLDWALALQNRQAVERNQLFASLKGIEEKVNIAVFTNVAAAILHQNEHLINICSPTIPVRGGYFSFIPECNSALVCLSSANSEECTTRLWESVILSNPTCTENNEGDCAGEIQLQENAFNCDITSKPERFVYIQLKVGHGAPSSLTKTAKLIDEEMTLSKIDGLEPGQSSLILTGKNICRRDDSTVEFSTESNIRFPDSSIGEYDGNRLNVSLSKDLDYALVNSVVSTTFKACGRTTNSIVINVTGSPPSIAERDYRFRVDKVISVSLDGQHFSSDNDFINLRLSTGSEKSIKEVGDNATINVNISGVEFESESSNRIHVVKTSKLKSSSVGSAVFVDLRISSSGLSSGKTKIGVVCDDITVNCNEGDGITSADPPSTNNTSGSKSAGVPGALIAGVVIGVVAVIGAFIEYKQHRTRQRRASEMGNPNSNSNLEFSQVV